MGSAQTGFGVDRMNKRICFYSGSYSACTEFHSLHLDTWQQVAVVQDVRNQKVIFYVDGVATERYANVVPQAGAAFAIGNYPSESGLVRPFGGLIEDVRVYDRSLSAAEVQTAGAAGAPAAPAAAPTPAPFDFALSTAGNRSVTAGAAVSNTITATLTGGAAQPVAFSAAGLPTGATAAFSTSQCAPSCLLNVTITAPASTPAGTSTVTITGVGGGRTKTTQFPLTVAAPAPPPPATLPPPTISRDSGVSDAPLVPANKRLLVVAPDGSGTHRTIQAAADSAQPGDTIQVKGGTYREYVTITRHGTRAAPITFMAAPGQRPVLSGGGWRVAAQWVIVDGFEVTQTNTGIHVTGITGPTSRHITLRNNWIHDNGFMGIFTNSTPDLLIEDNTLERNGLGPGQCTDALWGGRNYSHCHGIYTGNLTWCIADMARVTIRRNTFRANSGSAWQNYTNPRCNVRSRDFLVENNVVVDTAAAFYVIHLNDSVIRNNTIVQRTYAKPQQDAIEFMAFNASTNNTVANNLFYTTVDPASADLWVLHSWSGHANAQTFRNNAWFVRPGSRWLWGGALVPGEFLGTYVGLTGDSGAVVRPVTNPAVDAALLRNLAGGDFHLTASSPARDAGWAAGCPAVDKDGTPRPQGTRCDIGAYEFK
jgi:hypothetical protein